VIVLVSLATNPVAYDPEGAYTTIYRAAVAIDCPQWVGSGTAVTGLPTHPTETFILTAGHVCAGLKDRQVTLTSYCPLTGQDCKSEGTVIFVAEDENTGVDVAVIRPAAPEMFHPVALAPAVPRLGEVTVQVGRVDGRAVGLSLGLYRGRYNGEGGKPSDVTRYMQDSAVDRGASGTAVFVLRGRRSYFIGLLNWGSGNQGEAKWLMPADKVFETLTPQDPLGK
jgi:S1-C subfamily serine protease